MDALRNLNLSVGIRHRVLGCEISIDIDEEKITAVPQSRCRTYTAGRPNCTQTYGRAKFTLGEVVPTFQ